MRTFYLAGKNGFVISDKPVEYDNGKGGKIKVVKFSEDVRLAHQFNSFAQADAFGQRYMSKTYYDIMVPANLV